MQFYFLAVFIIIFNVFCKAQFSNDCIKIIDPLYFGPYAYYHLKDDTSCDSAKTDFSAEYYNVVLKSFPDKRSKSDIIKSHDFSRVWLSPDYDANGIIGNNYQRIQIHYTSVRKSKAAPNIYEIEGKSMVKNYICDFMGQIEIKDIVYFDSSAAFSCSGYSPYSHFGVLIARYTFYEDSSQFHSGVFKGTYVCSFFLDSTGYMQIDESGGGDGYSNNNFVGIWKDYKTRSEKKCIWGDYRLPYVCDFQVGDGLWSVNNKYLKNGWESFEKGTDYQWVDKRFIATNKWWLSK